MKSTKCKKHLQFCFWILSPVKYPLCDDLILNASTEKKKKIVKILGMNMHLHYARKLYVDSEKYAFHHSIWIEGLGWLQ